MDQLDSQIHHLKELDKERAYHFIEMNHYQKKVESLAKKRGGSKSFVGCMSSMPNKQSTMQPQQDVPLSKLNKDERNQIKLQQAIEGVTEFNERSSLIIECIERFIAKIKIDLTVRHTKHIQINHY